MTKINIKKTLAMSNTIKIILLIIVISSCNHPKIKNQIRRVWSTQFNECYCQWYSLNKVKKISKLELCEEFFSKEFPEYPTQENYLYCDDLVGFNAEAWAKYLTPKAKEIKRWGKDRCK